MNGEQIKALIAQGESDSLEFLTGETSAQRLARSVVGFLNGSGGTIILGAGPDGRVAGLSNAGAIANSLNTELPDLISPRAMWSVELAHVEEREVVVVHVPEGMEKPYMASGGVYLIRLGSGLVAATPADLSRMIQDRLRASERWERRLVPGAGLADLDSQVVRETMALAIRNNRWSGDPQDIESFLYDFGLGGNLGLTNAAVVLFGKQVGRFMPQAKVRLLVGSSGKIGERYAFDALFESCLITLVGQIETALRPYIAGVRSQFDDSSWKRQDTPLYPTLAVREGVLNAIIHRDYDIPGNTTIIVEPHQLKITNPGGLPEGLKVADLRKDHMSVLRNQDIAHMFFINQSIEKIGRGTQFILEQSKESGLREPKWECAEQSISLTFFAPRSGERSDPRSLSARESKIVEFLKEKGVIKVSDLEGLLGVKISDRTIRNDLQSL
ncbi:MAG: RNA-binding domain-containing protein, partial [Flavobacteriales bacterium]